jgi:hypothetical protein
VLKHTSCFHVDKTSANGRDDENACSLLRQATYAYGELPVATSSLVGLICSLGWCLFRS